MLLLILLMLALVLLPGLWVRRVMRRHSGHRSDFRGDGAAFARHLLDEHGMTEVGVEATDRGDHYDPTARMVRLSPENHAGRSLTAITVAAHEVGHAIQHHHGVGGLSTRTQLVGWAIRAERLGGGLMLAIPLLLILTRTPMSGALMFVGGALAFGSAALVHLVTLPVEWDASFRRALPILANGYLDTEDLAAARQILLAAALTYVGASLLAILNIWRWLAVLRR